MKSNSQGFEEAIFIQTDRRGGVTETGGETWRGSGGSRRDSPTFTYGGKKSGEIPWEREIPAPGQTK